MRERMTNEMYLVQCSPSGHLLDRDLSDDSGGLLLLRELHRKYLHNQIEQIGKAMKFG